MLCFNEHHFNVQAVMYSGDELNSIHVLHTCQPPEYKNLETSRNLQRHPMSQIFRIHQGTNSTQSEQRNSIF